MDEVKVIKAIYCTKQRRGKGVALDPIRCVTEIFDLKGNLIAENDSAKIFTMKDMANFTRFVVKSEEYFKKDIFALFEEWKLNPEK